MRALASTAHHAPRARILWMAGGAGVAVGAFLVGLAFAAVGDRFGPVVMLGLPIAAALSAAIFATPVLGIIALFASFPAAFIELPTDELGLQAAELMVVLVVGVIILRRLALFETPLPWSQPMLWGALFILWALVATPGAVDLEAAFRQDGQLIAAFLFALTVLAACRSMRQVRLAIGALLLIGAGMAAYGLNQLDELRTTFRGAVGINRAAGVFPQPNDLGAFAAILLMLAIGWTYGARTRRGRMVGTTAALFLAAATMFSLSRGAWIGTVVGGAVLLTLLPAARRTLLVLGVPLIAIGIAVIAVADPPDTPQIEVVAERISTFARPADNPYDDRPSIYREALREIRAQPVTGHGPGSFPATSLRAGSVARTVGAIHAHNVLLTVAAEIGIPGALLLIAFTAAIGLVATRAARSLIDPRDRAIVAGIAAGMVVQVGQGIVDFNLRNPVLLLLMASLVGFVLVARRQLAEERPEDPDAAEEGTS